MEFLKHAQFCVKYYSESQVLSIVEGDLSQLHKGYCPYLCQNNGPYVALTGSQISIKFYVLKLKTEHLKLDSKKLSEKGIF